MRQKGDTVMSLQQPYFSSYYCRRNAEILPILLPNSRKPGKLNDWGGSGEDRCRPLIFVELSPLHFLPCKRACFEMDT